MGTPVTTIGEVLPDGYSIDRYDPSDDAPDDVFDACENEEEETE